MQATNRTLSTTDGTKVLVVGLNKEINALKKTIVKTQNELEGWRTKYHDADKSNSVLNSKLEFFVGLELFKYLLSAIGAGYGINLVTSNKSYGWYFVATSALLYFLITFWQKK